MNWTDSWYNPEYAGEGIDLYEKSDGTIVGHFFSYDRDGRQLWLIGIGEREGDKASLRAWETSGGSLGSPEDLAKVRETVWGNIYLSEKSGDLSMRVVGQDGPDFSYELVPLLEATSPPADPSRQAVTITRTLPRPVVALNVPVQDRMGNPNQYEHVIEVVSGTLTISNVYGTGPYHPRVIGVRAGQVLRPGTEYPITYRIDPDYKWVRGSYVWSRFIIDTPEFNRPLLDLAVQVQRPDD